MSTVRCFACGEMGHYVRQCPKKKKQQDDTTTSVEEIDFTTQFSRECAFASSLSVVTPSNIRWGDKVEEDLLTHSSDLEGAQTQFSWKPYSRVTGPPVTNSVSELLRQKVGAGASEHQRLMRRRNTKPQRIEPHLATKTNRSGSGSTSRGIHLVRDQREDLW
jgi:hypothetical protein